MTDDFERAFEREKGAFADGLRESAEGESFRPLAADQVKGTRPSPGGGRAGTLPQQLPP